MSMAIAILDTDVLIDMLDFIAKGDRESFKEMTRYLSLRFEKIWIPKTVKDEYIQNKKTKNRFYRFLRHPFVEKCPISIGKSDIALLIDKIDKGEADAILQAQKTEVKQSFRNESVVFISNDTHAIDFALQIGVGSIHYTELKTELREGGYIG